MNQSDVCQPNEEWLDNLDGGYKGKTVRKIILLILCILLIYVRIITHLARIISFLRRIKRIRLNPMFRRVPQLDILEQDEAESDDDGANEIDQQNIEDGFQLMREDPYYSDEAYDSGETSFSEEENNFDDSSRDSGSSSVVYDLVRLPPIRLTFHRRYTGPIPYDYLLALLILLGIPILVAVTVFSFFI